MRDLLVLHDEAEFPQRSGAAIDLWRLLEGGLVSGLLGDYSWTWPHRNEIVVLSS